MHLISNLQKVDSAGDCIANLIKVIIQAVVTLFFGLIVAGAVGAFLPSWLAASVASLFTLAAVFGVGVAFAGFKAQ